MGLRATKSGLDIEAIRSAHMLEQKYAGECCDQDDQPFPCDAVALLGEVDELRAANVGLIADMADIAAERDKAWVEVTHRVGWEERCLRAEAALRQILEDPDAKILDSHRDDGWEALGVKPQATALRIEDECDADD